MALSVSCLPAKVNAGRRLPAPGARHAVGRKPTPSPDALAGDTARPHPTIRARVCAARAEPVPSVAEGTAVAAHGFTAADREQLAARGVALEEAERQLDRLSRPPRYVELIRPCTVGDGIERLGAEVRRDLLAAHATAVRAGRFLKFVPASGAATRMFADLHGYLEAANGGSAWDEIARRAANGERAGQTVVTLLREIRSFAFHDDLEGTLRRRGQTLDSLAECGEFEPILHALLDAGGLDYSGMPKGLIKFHRYADGSRTAFEEHLVEAAMYARDGAGLCRLHLTVAPAERARFEQVLERHGPRHAERLGARFEVGYSFQKPSTDTIAVDARGRLLRDEQGRLRFRPAGHGALIDNLDALGADLVFIKNIDNVQPDRAKGATVEWKSLLAGRLVHLQRAVHALLERLAHPAAPDVALEAASRFLRSELSGSEPAGAPPSPQCRRASLIDRLNRPIRVCGVVPATGEPGGGPFWVRAGDGSAGVQIVESAQVDPDDEAQQHVWRSSTHFNPVDLVCAVRDPSGEPQALARFVDTEATIVTSKSEGGREIKVLERPGLWNGAMAGWNTAFVEVPLDTFTPVKTVLDLLRPEHQP